MLAAAGCSQNLVLLASATSSTRSGTGAGACCSPASPRPATSVPCCSQEPVRGRKLVLVAVLVVDLGALGAFKYFGFFADSFAAALRGVGLHADWVTLHLVLPVGISYYVFQNLSYVIDVYRRDLPATRGVRRVRDRPQLLPAAPRRAHHAAARPAAAALRAPRLRRRARPRRPAPGALGPHQEDAHRRQHRRAGRLRVAQPLAASDGVSLVAVAVLYSIQIYCDFSGYADIAIGTAKLFNLRLSKNFDYPYFSVSVRMFWRRWHITLASWMRDYVYIPLGGSRVGAVAPRLQRARHLPARRPLARRQLDVRRLGRPARLLPRRREPAARGRHRARAARRLGGRRDAVARRRRSSSRSSPSPGSSSARPRSMPRPSSSARRSRTRSAPATYLRFVPDAAALGGAARLRVVHARLGARPLDRRRAAAGALGRLPRPLHGAAHLRLPRHESGDLCPVLGAEVRSRSSCASPSSSLVFAALARGVVPDGDASLRAPLAPAQPATVSRFDPQPARRPGCSRLVASACAGGEWRVNNAGWNSASPLSALRRTRSGPWSRCSATRTSRGSSPIPTSTSMPTCRRCFPGPPPTRSGCPAGTSSSTWP